MLKLSKSSWLNTPKKVIWEDGKAVFMIKDSAVYVSKTLKEQLNLSPDDRFRIVYQDKISYICNATEDANTIPGNSFRVTKEEDGLKGASKCRNKVLIGIMIDNTKFNLPEGVPIPVGNFTNEGMYVGVINPKVKSEECDTSDEDDSTVEDVTEEGTSENQVKDSEISTEDLNGNSGEMLGGNATNMLGGNQDVSITEEWLG